jgi:hypothetical protein
MIERQLPKGRLNHDSARALVDSDDVDPAQLRRHQRLLHGQRLRPDRIRRESEGRALIRVATQQETRFRRAQPAVDERSIALLHA